MKTSAANELVCLMEAPSALSQPTYARCGQNSLALCDRDSLCQTLIRFVTASNLYVRFTPKAYIRGCGWNVRFVPIADIRSGGVVRKCDCSISLGPQRTHSRSGSGLPPLSSADPSAYSTHASSAPCHSASSFPARWPSSGLAPGLMLCKRKTLLPKSAK